MIEVIKVLLESISGALHILMWYIVLLLFLCAVDLSRKDVIDDLMDEQFPDEAEPQEYPQEEKDEPQDEPQDEEEKEKPEEKVNKYGLH